MYYEDSEHFLYECPRCYVQKQEMMMKQNIKYEFWVYRNIELAFWGVVIMI